MIQALTLDGNAPVTEPRMAAGAERLARSEDSLMRVIFSPHGKASSPVEPKEAQADQQCDI
jgi:hypothetical protein